MSYAIAFRGYCLFILSIFTNDFYALIPIITTQMRPNEINKIDAELIEVDISSGSKV